MVKTLFQHSDEKTHFMYLGNTCNAVNKTLGNIYAKKTQPSILLHLENKHCERSNDTVAHKLILSCWIKQE